MSRRSSSDETRIRPILAWLAQREDEIAALLTELVAIPTENPPGRNYRACVDLLDRRLREFGFVCRRMGPSSQKKEGEQTAVCLLAGYGNGNFPGPGKGTTRTLYFHGHYDVVPAQSQEQFQPLRKKHFLFGRGSCDMKGGIVAMLFAMRALKESGAELGGNIGLTLVPNEETGGESGSAWLAREGLLGRNGIGMLLAEPTSGAVWHASRGAISLLVEVFGKSAHVGLQHRGANAFERVHYVVGRLQQLKREIEKRTTRFPIGAEQSRNSILMLGGQSGGGTNFNVVPEKCWFTVDRRINPEEDFEEEKTKLLGLLERCKREGIPLEWEIFQEGRSAACPEDGSLGQALSRSVKSVTGKVPRFEMCPGLLEIRFYAAAGIPAYAYGPGLLSVAHGPNEYVDLRKVRDTAAIYALTAMDILKR